MHNLHNELQDRYERQMKAKIYREMLDEQIRYKNMLKQQRVQRHQSRINTQPVQYLYKKRNYHLQNQEQSLKSDQKFPPLKQQSIFLPVLESKKQQDSKKRYADHSKAYDTLRNSYAYPESSQDDQAQKYLSQCEQIIGSLRELTNRKKKKKQGPGRQRNSMVYTPIKQMDEFKYKPVAVSYNGSSANVNERSRVMNYSGNEGKDSGKEPQIQRFNVIQSSVKKSRSRLMTKSKEKPTKFYGDNNEYENQFLNEQTIPRAKSPKRTFTPIKIEKDQDQQEMYQSKIEEEEQQNLPKSRQLPKRVNKYQVEPKKSRASEQPKVNSSKLLDKSQLNGQKLLQSSKLRSRLIKYDIDAKYQDQEIKDQEEDADPEQNQQYHTISHQRSPKKENNLKAKQQKSPSKSPNKNDAKITFAPADEKDEKGKQPPTNSQPQAPASKPKQTKDKKNEKNKEKGTQAMLNYLKKAKLRGKQLFEKIQSFKKQKDPEEPQGQADPNLSPNQNQNQSQSPNQANTSPNPTPVAAVKN